MKADEMRLGPLLSGQKQYVVPYFQRAYSWRRHQWNTLFDDILELYDLKSENSHFLGSMVLLAEKGTDALNPTLLIDGQQRLVTLSLFLAAIRDVARHSDAAFAAPIHYSYLVNPALAEHERWYTALWNPMEGRLGERFDDYMRDFVLKEGQPVRPDDVYQEWRKRLGPLDEEDIRSVLREVAEWAVEYGQILHPQREGDADVRKRLQRLTA